jgi:transcriptional regulator with GAF, ATPase, and Fis domain
MPAEALSLLGVRVKAAADATARTEIRRALNESGGNVSEAARSLGVDRSNLRREMRRLGMRRTSEAVEHWSEG